jgi:hypothetical protein
MTDQWPEESEPFSFDDLRRAYEAIRDQPYTLSRQEARAAEIARLEADFHASESFGDPS